MLQSSTLWKPSGFGRVLRLVYLDALNDLDISVLNDFNFHFIHGVHSPEKPDNPEKSQEKQIQVRKKP